MEYYYQSKHKGKKIDEVIEKVPGEIESLKETKADKTETVILDADGKVPDEKLHNPIKNLTDGTEPNSLQTQNSQAISEGAIALGKNSIAGSKCFNITAFDDTNKSYTLDSVEGLEVGDVYSLKLDYIYDNKGTITAINGNVVTVDNYYPDENADRYFRVPKKPTCGTTDFGLNGMAFGEDCVAAGENSFSTGKGNRSSGKYAFTIGKNCEAGYGSFAGGRDSNVLGENSFGFGFGVDVPASLAAAVGRNAKALKQGASAFGFHAEAREAYSTALGHVIAGSPYQTVCGYGNIVDENGDYIFIVGNGTGRKQSNAFTVSMDGDGLFAKDVANKKGDRLSYKANKSYVDSELAKKANVEDMSKKADLEDVANAVKHRMTGGSALSIGDISPLTHDVGVRIAMPNLLSYPYPETTKTVNGITYTDNGDGSITANGTAVGGNAAFTLKSGTKFDEGTFVISGCPSGGGSSEASYNIHITLYKNNKFVVAFTDIGQGSPEFNCEEYDYDKYVLMISVNLGAVCDNLVFHPKLSLSPTTTTLTVKDENDEVQATYTPNSDGTVSSVKSIYPVMKLEVNDTNATITAEYNVDTNSALDDIKSDLSNKADAINEYDGFNAGKDSSAQDGGAIGSWATTRSGGAIGGYSESVYGGAVGGVAKTSNGGSVGNGSQSADGGAIGQGAVTSDGFAGGKEAEAVKGGNGTDQNDGIDAIQLGKGRNTIPKTLQIYDYQLMDADGNIPVERLTNATANKQDKINIDTTTDLYNVLATLKVNTLYKPTKGIEGVDVVLPSAQVGDFIQVDFYTISDMPVLSVEAPSGIMDLDLKPEKNKVYSLYFDWGVIGVDSNNNINEGWRFSYTEYDPLTISE